MTLDLRPISRDEARRFVAANHRHSPPPQGWLFGVALELDGVLVGVGMAGRPLARMLDDGRTIEVTRICTLGNRNAASRLYGSICRAAQALGYRRAVTYTLAVEEGASLRASGFACVAIVEPRDSWARDGRPRYDSDLWGNTTRSVERRRWERSL